MVRPKLFQFPLKKIVKNYLKGLIRTQLNNNSILKQHNLLKVYVVKFEMA